MTSGPPFHGSSMFESLKGCTGHWPSTNPTQPQEKSIRTKTKKKKTTKDRKITMDTNIDKIRTGRGDSSQGNERRHDQS